MSATREGMRMCWSVHVRALTPHTCVLVAHSLALPIEVALELSQPVVSGVSQSSSPCPLVSGTEPEGQAGLQFVCLWHLVLSPRVAVEKPGPRSCDLSLRVLLASTSSCVILG